MNCKAYNCFLDVKLNMYMPVDNEKKTYVEPDFIDFKALDMYIEQCNIRNVILAGDLSHKMFILMTIVLEWI